MNNIHSSWFVRMKSWIPSSQSSAQNKPGDAEPVEFEASFFPKMDWVLWVITFAFLSLGIVMTYSASAIPVYRVSGSTTHYLSRELMWAVLGSLALIIGANLDYRWFKKSAYSLLGLTIILLLAVLFTAKVNGAHRWFRYGSFSFQPAELAKLTLVIYLAQSLSRKSKQLHSFAEGFVPPLLICGLLMVLLLLQPDLGTAVILWLVTLTLLFVAGTKVVFILASVLTAAPIVYMKFLINTRWRLERIQAFLDPWLYQNTVGYQITSSLLCVGSGGIFGTGLGLGRLKLHLPEAHTDYILAVVGEELGFVGIFLVAIGFIILILRGIKAAKGARDSFGYYLAYGITAMIGFQAAINMGVVLGVLPTKGLTLPFISFGGSSLIINFFAMGILLNISKGTKESSSPLRIHQLGRALFPKEKNRHVPGAGRKIIIEP